MRKTQTTGARRPLLSRIYTLYIGFFEKMSEDHVSAFSAQAAFFLLLSVFPLLMIMLNLTRYMPFTQEDIIMLIANVVPAEFVQYITSIIADLYDKSHTTLLSVSVLVTLWSAAKGMQAIANGLDSVYECECYLGYFRWRLIGMIYTLFFIVLIVVTLCLFVFGNAIYHTLVVHFPHLNNIAELVIGMRSVVGIALLFVFFLLLYTYLPDNKGIKVRKKIKRKPGHQIYGAAFSAVAWVLLSYAFSLYIDNFSRFSYMYGSLTTIILAMFWLYMCMYIIFIGGEINVYLKWKHHDLKELREDIRIMKQEEEKRKEAMQKAGQQDADVREEAVKEES